jgi:hypothetical protein
MNPLLVEAQSRRIWIVWRRALKALKGANACALVNAVTATCHESDSDSGPTLGE